MRRRVNAQFKIRQLKVPISDSAIAEANVRNSGWHALLAQNVPKPSALV
jgi:hypothetical protein